MAKNNAKSIKKLVEALRKSNITKEENKYEPAEQVEGYKRRLEGSGLDPEKETDGRSFLEKAFNLPDDQNVLFDIFEIINRPQQALFGAIKNAQTGDNILQGAKEGLTGRKDTQFKDILHEAGVIETEGQLGADDVFGFVGDVLLDPMDLAVFGAGKAAKAAKAAKIADRVNDLAKLDDAVVKATDNLLLAEKGVRRARNIRGIEKAERAVKIAEQTAAVEAAKEALEVTKAGVAMGEKALKAAQDQVLRKRTALQLIASGAGTGFKGSFKFLDSKFEWMLENWDKFYLRNAKRAGIDINLKNHTGALYGYKNIKDMIQTTFDVAKKLPDGLFEKVRKIRGEQGLAKNKALIVFNEDMKYIDEQIDVIQEAYKAKFGKEIDKKNANLFLITLYERGDVFDLDGKYIQGLNRKHSLRGMVSDDSFMFNQGVLEPQKEMIENFVKEYYPDWYKANVQSGTSMWIETPQSDRLKTTYRWNLGESKLGDLRARLKNTYPDERLVKGKIVPTEVLERRKELDEAIHKYNEAAERGSKKALREGSKEAQKVAEYRDRVLQAREHVASAQKKIEKLVGTSDPKKLKKLDKLKEGIESATKLEAQLLDEIAALVHKHEKPIGELILEAQREQKKLIKVHGLESIPDILGEDAIDAMNKIIEIEDYIAPEARKQIEEFAQVEGVPELLATIHATMTKLTNIINTTVEGGIDLTPGYFSHAITSEWAQLNLNKFKRMDAKAKESWASAKNLIGNANAMSTRKYQASIFEANEMAKDYAQFLADTGGYSDIVKEQILTKKNMDMFATDLRTSMIDFIDKSPKAIADSRLLNSVIIDAFDPSTGDTTGKYVIELSSENPKIPFGYTEVKGAALKRKVEAMKKYLPKELVEEFDTKLGPIFNSIDSKVFAIDNNINTLIGRITDPKGANELLKLTNFLTNIFKQNKLLSPGFQLRNIVGNYSNMWLSGMSFTDINKYNIKANRFLKEGEELLKKVTTDASFKMSKEQLETLTVFQEFIEHGFGELGNALHDIPEHLWNVNLKVQHSQAAKKHLESLKTQLKSAKDPAEIASLNKQIAKAKAEVLTSKPKAAYDKMVAWNMEKNQNQDKMFRMSLFLYGKENPEFLINNGYESAQDGVRKILFDYLDLSNAEREVMRKVVPFYTFTKKNLAFQMANLQKNTSRYNQMIKAFNSTWNMLDLEDSEVDRYKIENFWIPIPFKDKDGKYRAIKSSLPLGDLGEWLSEPFRRALSSTSPIVRAPFEIALNRQVFSNMPIQEFKGQKGFQIPEFGRKLEYATNQFGLDVPMSAAMDLGRTTKNVIMGEETNIFSALEKGLGRSVINTGDPAATAERRAYNELDNMRNLMRYYKQEGVNILTLAEIENGKKMSSYRNTIQRLRDIKKRA